MRLAALLFLLLPVVLFAEDDPWADEDWGDETETQVWSGFIDAGFGTRFDSDPLTPQRQTLGELRLRVESNWQPKGVEIGFKADVYYDAVTDEFEADLRDLSAAFSVGQNLDVRIGRQVQTWGSGDLVFLNDLFPKDFESFFSGRDDEYLKAPGNAIRLTRYAPGLNVDFVWTPVFEPDVYLTGERFSFFSPLAGGNVAPSPPLAAIDPRESFSNGEFALRLFRTVEGREYALYAYRGFFKQPNALTPSLTPTFAPLTSFGASLRRPLGPGLFNAESAWYSSRDDRSGRNPLVPNDQLRFLAGYEWEAAPSFTVGLQYYVEWTLDHDALLANSPFPAVEPEETRHVITNRLTYRMARDKHTLSLFSFVSPSDQDFYLRPVYAYRHSDAWLLTAGANLFGGSDPHTFFNQLQDGSNAYLRLTRYY